MCTVWIYGFQTVDEDQGRAFISSFRWPSAREMNGCRLGLQLLIHVFYRFCEVLCARVVDGVVSFSELDDTNPRHHVHHASYVVGVANSFFFASHKNPHRKFFLSNGAPFVLAHDSKNKAKREVLHVNVGMCVCVRCVSTHACVCGLRRQTCVRGETPDHQLPSGSSAARPLCRHPSISSVPYH